MTPDQQQQLKAHLTGIARILYADAEEKQMDMDTLGEIEQTIRTQLQEQVSPELALFLSTIAPNQTQGLDANSTAS